MAYNQIVQVMYYIQIYALNSVGSCCKHLLEIIHLTCRTLYGLQVLRAHDMSDDCIQEVFRSTVLAKLVYASSAWSGFCSASDVSKIDRYLNRCKHLNYCSLTTTCITELFDKADRSLFQTVL